MILHQTSAFIVNLWLSLCQANVKKPQTYEVLMCRPLSARYPHVLRPLPACKTVGAVNTSEKMLFIFCIYCVPQRGNAAKPRVGALFAPTLGNEHPKHLP